jgi:guanylate kinase
MATGKGQIRKDYYQIMMYLIMGRTASGKDYFAKLLEQRGLVGVKSHTTRPPRSSEEDTHVFVSQDEANKLTDRVAYTKIGDYEYFATPQDVEDKDFYVIDPVGLTSLAENMPDKAFRIIYVQASRDERKRHFVARQSCPKEEAEKLFEERDAAETKQFDEFEAKIDDTVRKGLNSLSNMKFPRNVHALHTFLNQFETAPDDIVHEADAIADEKRCHRMLTEMAMEASELRIVLADDRGRISIHYNDNSGTPVYVRPEMFASILMSDVEGLGMFMTAYLGRSRRLKME